VWRAGVSAHGVELGHSNSDMIFPSEFVFSMPTITYARGWRDRLCPSLPNSDIKNGRPKQLKSDVEPQRVRL
jgi:hypothetical protein